VYIVGGRHGLRSNPHLGLGRLRDDRRGGGIPPLCRRNCGSTRRRRAGFLVFVVVVERDSVGAVIGAGVVAGLGPVGGGKSRGRVLCSLVCVASLATLGGRRKGGHWGRRREGGLWGGRRVEPP
jgi:hypothetical protein